jgi:hypothetical protein
MGEFGAGVVKVEKTLLQVNLQNVHAKRASYGGASASGLFLDEST